MKFWKKGCRSSRVTKTPPFSEGYRQAPKDLLPFTPVSDVFAQSALLPTGRLLNDFTSDIHAFPIPFVMHACPRECAGILDRWLGVGVLSVGPLNKNCAFRFSGVSAEVRLTHPLSLRSLTTDVNHQKQHSTHSAPGYVGFTH